MKGRKKEVGSEVKKRLKTRNKVKISTEVKKEIRLQLKTADSADDRLLAKILLDEVLTEFEQHKWNLFSRIISLTENGYPNKTVAKMIQKEYGYNHVTSVYSLINRALSIFGDVRVSVDPKIQKVKRKILADEFKELARLSKNAMQYKDAGFFLDKYAKYEGLDDKNEISTIPDFTQVLLTTDSSVLEIDQEDQDTDFIEDNEHSNS